MMNLKRHTASKEAQPNNDWMAPLPDRTSGEFSTLVLDRFGHVRSCGESAVNMFHMSRSRLLGRSASDLLPDLFEKSTPVGLRAKQLADLARSESWRPQQMTDAEGHCFAVALCLSSVVVEGQNIFFAHLHRASEFDTV